MPHSFVSCLFISPFKSPVDIRKQSPENFFLKKFGRIQRLSEAESINIWSHLDSNDRQWVLHDGGGQWGIAAILLACKLWNALISSWEEEELRGHKRPLHEVAFEYYWQIVCSMPAREVPEGQQDRAHAHLSRQHTQQLKRRQLQSIKLTEVAIYTATVEDKKVIFIKVSVKPLWQIND